MASRRSKKKKPHSRLVRKSNGAPVTADRRKQREKRQATTPPVAEINRLGRPTISACLIVKNEEEYLPGCLESIKGLVDEIVIVDTGSTDKTVEIAEKSGARVYHHQWENDFSKARNISIAYGTGDWIFIIDADEKIEAADLPLIKKTLAQTPHKAVAISVYNFSPSAGESTSFLPSIRFFRRDLGAYYDGIVHNQLHLPGGETALRISAHLWHYGYALSPEKMAKKIERSRALLEAQLAESPDYAFAHFNLAQLLRAAEEIPSPEMMDKVIYHASRAIELTDPAVPDQRHIHLMAMHQLVTAYHKKGDYKQAEQWCHQALALRPDYLDPVLNLGHIYAATGRFEQARKYYLEYLDLQKNYNEHDEVEFFIVLHLHSRANAYYGLGLVCEQEDKYHEAFKWYDKCEREQENYLDVNYRRAAAHYRLGELEQTVDYCRKQLKLNPKHGESQILLAEVRHRQGRVEEAEKYLHAALAVGDEHSIAYYRLSTIEREKGNFGKALEYINSLLAYDPELTDAYQRRADIYFARNEYALAAADYERCLANNPDDALLQNNLGNCCLKQGDFVAAESRYRQAAGADPGFVEAHRNWGLALLRLERDDDAIAAFEDFLQKFPGDTDVIGTLGDLYCRCGRISKAITCYEEVVAACPERTATWLRLADCYHNRGSFDAALVGYERVLQLKPDHGPTLERLADLRQQLLRQREFNQARLEPLSST